jgi:hypothetical protein
MLKKYVTPLLKVITLYDKMRNHRHAEQNEASKEKT